MITDFFIFQFIGFFAGIIIGLSGMGGGAFITPCLIFLGIPPQTAICTDLIYAFVTKLLTMVSRLKGLVINKQILVTMILGSLTGALMMSLVIKDYILRLEDFRPIITTALSYVLVVVAIALITSNFLLAKKKQVEHIDDMTKQPASTKTKILMTFIAATFIGCIVPLTSIGSGAIGIVVLLLLYPRLHIKQIVNIDISYAIPLTAVSWISLYLITGNYGDLILLIQLLTGSLPGIFVSKITVKKVNSRFLSYVLATLLLITSVKLSKFS